MGVSTDGQICFGIDFGEDEMPWHALEDREIDEWWRRRCGWTRVWTEAGSDEFFAAQREFDEKHPLPIEDVLHCSGEYPLTILAVKDTKVRAFRGYPEVIPSNLGEPNAEALESFIRDVLGVEPKKPEWILSSMWW